MPWPRHLTWIVLALMTLGVGWAQETHAPPAVPTEEHDFLRQFSGEWTAVGKGTDVAGKSVDMKGLEIDRLVLGDFWLFLIFQSQIPEQPFVGHGMIGYDPIRRKYVGTWVDSLSPYLGTLEGTADPKTRTLTLEMAGTNAVTGKPSHDRLVYRFQDPEHRSVERTTLEDPEHPRLILRLDSTKNQLHSK
ncbi:MAG TPA: DUF1579 family protein [Planctomycetota bacterium]|nr:DUF1579 family protein [Planctomycetota bacterium]